ncbi:MAG: DUF2092 domain-containing protein [Betaproteobacteria bacterium]|nr:DUF2092 domain-containing protein [Betaproteobacteria bacterium]
MFASLRNILIALAWLALTSIEAAAAAIDLEPRALDLLNASTSRLERAKTLTFRTRTPPGDAADGSLFTNLLADTQFAVMRPDRVRAKVRGDSAPLDVFFDGKTLAVYQPTLNMYATSDDPGALEVLIPFALARVGVLFPLADVLAGDTEQLLARRPTRARYKGVATISGRQCEHAAFAATGVEWELWVDGRTSLPCRVRGRLFELRGAPRFAADFHDWKLNPQLSAASFSFAKPAGAGRLDLRTLLGE